MSIVSEVTNTFSTEKLKVMAGIIVGMIIYAMYAKKYFDKIQF